MRSALPSLYGGVGGGSPFSWGKLLKIVITVLTALAGALGVASCTGGLTPSLSQGEGAAGIAENTMPCQYENAFISRDV